MSGRLRTGLVTVGGVIALDCVHPAARLGLCSTYSAGPTGRGWLQRLGEALVRLGDPELAAARDGLDADPDVSAAVVSAALDGCGAIGDGCDDGEPCGSRQVVGYHGLLPLCAAHAAEWEWNGNAVTCPGGARS